MEEKTVALLGTGIMGSAMGANLLANGMNLRVWNRTREKAEPLESEGATIADSPADAVRGCGFVLTMLHDAAAVDAAMSGDRGALEAMGADALWLQCSTVGVDATQRLADAAERHDVGFVDVPVLGTKKPAQEGKLVALASGSADLEARCRPVLLAAGAHKVLWLGPAGTGSRLKLVMNSWVLALVGAVAEAVALAEGLGLEPQLFLDVLEGSQLDCPYAHIKAAAMTRRALEPSFPASGARKDAGLILDAARQVGVRADVVAAVCDKFQRTIDGGHGDEDMAAAYFATVAD